MTLKSAFLCGFHSFAEFNVFLTFVLLGMSIMLVVSAITSAPNFVEAFWMYATGDPDAECEKPYFWNNANTFYNVGTYAAQFICEPMALLTFVRRIPLRIRLFTGLGIMLVEMILLIVIPSATISSQDGAIAVIMVVSVMGGFSKALVDSTTNALVGPFPTKFMNGELWGLAVISLFMSVIQCILKGSMDSDYKGGLNQSRIYIAIGIAVQLIAIVELAILPLNPFAQKYAAEFRVRAQQRQHREGESNGSSAAPNNGDEDPYAPQQLQDRTLSPEELARRRDSGDLVEPSTADNSPLRPGFENGPVEGEIHLDDVEVPSPMKRDPLDTAQDSVTAVDNANRAPGGGFLSAKGDADGMQDLDQTGNLTSSDQLVRTSAVQVIKHVWPMLLCVFGVFFTSMLLFPGVFFKVPTTDEWYMTIIVLLFNVGDFVARIVLMIRPARPPPKAVIAGALGRLIIIPFLVVCARGLIRGVALPYVLVTLLGLTNGVFGAMAMIHCPRTPTLVTAGQRSIAAQWGGCFLMAGLACGSFLALAITLTWKPIS